MELCSSSFENVEVADNASSIPSARLTVFTPVKTTKAWERKIAPQLRYILLSVTPEKVIECQKGDTSASVLLR